MERQQFNAYFFAWLRGALPLALLLGICGGIFAGVFFLYGVPAEALAYAGALCLAAALPFFLWRFFRGWQRCRQFYRLTQLPPLEIGKLPTEGSPAEEIWQQLTEKLLEEIRARETRWQSWQQQSCWSWNRRRRPGRAPESWPWPGSALSELFYSFVAFPPWFGTELKNIFKTARGGPNRILPVFYKKKKHAHRLPLQTHCPSAV